MSLCRTALRHRSMLPLMLALVGVLILSLLLPANVVAAPPIQREPDDDTAIIHYHRPDGEYTGWGLHVWEDTTETVTWEEPLPPTGEDGFGLYWTVSLTEDADTLGFIVHRGEEKDPGPDQFLDLTQSHAAWILSGDLNVYTTPPDPNAILPGDITVQQAHWVDVDTLLWDVGELPPDSEVTLHYASNGGMQLTETGIVGRGSHAVLLTPDPAGPGPETVEKYPHLADYAAFTLPAGERRRAPVMVRSQLAVQAMSADGELLNATGLQISGVLDDLFFYPGQLGVVWADDIPTLKLWAPTAKNVRLYLFDGAADEDPEIINMKRGRGDELSVWSVEGEAGWTGNYYLYEVRVYVPGTGQIETNLVTDPYSVSLSANSGKSQIVDLDDPALQPEGWDTLEKPPLQDFEDIVLYELHVRDFSAYDETVPAQIRGTYLAFTLEDSAGVQHLKALAGVGLTHLHLLPTFDIATIDENKDQWVQTHPLDLAEYPPDSPEPQAIISEIRDQDGFNWGYDPFHYTVPEGSYSTDPEGTPRILEYRHMVQALNQMGLRVVADVVYNHTNASGQAERSVLDKIVPGYYHRLNRNGAVETSTCCANTATEHAMMEKLMLDSLLTWATQYKIDAFRFDLMGHHMLENMVDVRAALDSLTEAEDGVDGSQIYIYGEGWNFGEVADNARGVNATQLNLPGTGIGTFNDRLRDAVRGIGPFDSGEDLRKQGFVSGLYLDPNAAATPSDADQLRRLLQLTDQIRTGMAGNLRDYAFIDHRGAAVTGAEVDYNGSPAGYTLDPQEDINYISAHDNQTLFDVLTYGAPVDTPMRERVKMQEIALSIVGLGQGIPFFHAGSDILRSKSFDRNSYNSGDWFNALDWTYQDNNFGRGLPLAADNEGDWPVMQPLLANADLKPTNVDITTAAEYFRQLLSVRRSSGLFRLETAEQIDEMVHYHNTGPEQIPGLIVQSITDLGEGDADVDPDREVIFVLLNTRPQPVDFQSETLVGMGFTLHPDLYAEDDPRREEAYFSSDVGRFVVPGRSAAVFQAGTLTATFVDALADLEARITELRTDPPDLPAEEEPAETRPAPQSVGFPGTIGSALGGADWTPDDPVVQATDADGDGIWELTATLPQGTYEFKVAINGSWDENYGALGEPNGANIGLPVTTNNTEVTFTYDRATDAIQALVNGEDISIQGETPAEPEEDTDAVESVSFPGSHAPAIGGTEWEPADPAIQARDEDGDGVWTLNVELPAGAYEFKAAVNGSWDENYGLGGELNGPNVPLTVSEPGSQVTFYYDRRTNAVWAEVPPQLGDGQIGQGGLLHDSRSDRYRIPFGAVPENTDVTLRFRTYAGDVETVRLIVKNESTGASTVVPLELVATVPPPPWPRSGEGVDYAWWEATINSSSAPTIHTYTFEIADGDGVLYYVDRDQDGGVGNVLNSPPTLAEGGGGWDIYTYVPGFESPDWARNAVIYQIFPDRFRNGREENDPTAEDWFYPEERGHAFPVAPWNTIVPDPVPNDPAANPDWHGTFSSTFYGGDLQGVMEKLDYLQDLGVTAIYFNPIFESPSNHRYDGRTYDLVEDALGIEGDWEASLAILEDLGQAAAERGMHLILDGVPNHLSSDAYIFDRYSRHEPEGGCESVDSPYRDWFFFRLARPEGSGECAGDTTYDKWFNVATLPQLNNTIEEVIENWLDPEDGVAVRWLRVPGVDGWRIDVVPDVAALNPAYFKFFRDVVKAEHPDAMLYSETWWEPEVRHRVLGDEFDSTMNYRFRQAVLGFLRDVDWQDGDSLIPALSPSQFDGALRAIQEDYPPAAWQSAMNLISSHDVNRAVRVLDHDGIDYGRLEPINDFVDGRNRLRLAAVLQFTLPGAPTIYYGDEVGLVGFGSDVPRDDPYNRQPYPWPDEPGYADLPAWRQQHEDLLAHYQFLGQLRNQHSFLRTGAWDTFIAGDTGGLYVYGRKDGTGAAIIALNRGTEPATVDLALQGYVPQGAAMIDAVTDEAGAVPLLFQVEPMGFRIWITAPDVDMSVPDAPEITSTQEDEGQVVIEATSSDPDAVALVLYRSPVDGGYEPIQTAELTAPESPVVFTDNEVENGRIYFYRVGAVDANGMISPLTAPIQLIPRYTIDTAALVEPLAVEHIISAITPTVPLAGRVFIEDVTEAEGQAPGIIAELGMLKVEPAVTANAEQVIWTRATYTGEQDGGDVYSAQILPNQTGDYIYGWRFSTTGGMDWTYAGASGIDADLPWSEPGQLTVLPSEDTTAPNRPFRISQVLASPSQIVIEWRVSRTPDLHHYFVCRRDVTGGEEDPCATNYVVLRGAQILTDTAVTQDHIYEYTVQTVDEHFNHSETSDVLAVEAAENFVDVTFRVRVPAFTPEADVIYIAGNERDVFGGAWNAGIQPMVEVEENVWEWTIDVKTGMALQYKYTRGSWDRVEQWGSITGTANRSVEITAGPEGILLVDDTATDWDEGPDAHKAVRNWRDPLVAETDTAADAVTVVFNSAVTPAQTPGEVLVVAHEAGEEVSGVVQQTGERTFVFTPDQPLVAGAYTAQAFNVTTDVPMQQPYAWEFVVD